MIAGLGFGDEGKGSITDYLTVREKAHTVVRYNGGAQAAHNVVLPDCRHHTFSQFGSGTLNGAATHLSRFVIIEPMALRNEANALKLLGISNPFDLLTIERGAPLITPYQRGANRLREILRGSAKHGSCGVGVGETVSDHLTHGDAVPKIEDLFKPKTLQEKLSFVRDLKLAEFSGIDLLSTNVARHTYDAFKMLTLPVYSVMELWTDVARSLRLVDNGHLQKIIDKKVPIIFEGAQGMLLDQSFGFHPYTTWTDISFNNAHRLLGELNHVSMEDIEKIGVIRTYLTRHGAGPFPTEIRNPEETTHLVEEFNDVHDWQGGFRIGHFDMMLFLYALDVIGHIDHVAVTHVDYLDHVKKMCISYDPASANLHEFMINGRLKRSPIDDIIYQDRLGHALEHAGLRRNYWPVNDDFVDILEDMAKVKVSILSRGPTSDDKLRQ